MTLAVSVLPESQKLVESPGTSPLRISRLMFFNLWLAFHAYPPGRITSGLHLSGSYFFLLFTSSLAIRPIIREISLEL